MRESNRLNPESKLSATMWPSGRGVSEKQQENKIFSFSKSVRSVWHRRPSVPTVNKTKVVERYRMDSNCPRCYRLGGVSLFFLSPLGARLAAGMFF